ncbi:MAG: ComEC/Rec2 family competence protein [Pseudomonadota bacterium]
MRKRSLFSIVAIVLFFSLSAEAQVSYRDHALVVDKIEGPTLTVHFIDVGQGDAVLVQAPTGETLLIDTGPRKRTANPLSYLQALGIERIDRLLITHSHLDHTGGFLKIVKALPVGEFWWSGHFHATKSGATLLKKVEELKIPTRALQRGDELTLGKDVKIKVLHPPQTMKPVDHDINNYSVVIRVTYGDIDFLFTGDAEIKAERMILAANLPVESEFLKLGHHGSATATTLAFLKSVHPEFGVISCGRNNKYGHPHDITLEHLTEAGVAILRTDDVGTVVVRTDGKHVSVHLKGQRATRVLLRDAGPITHVIINIGRREDDEALQSLDRLAGRVPAREHRLGRAA